MRVCCLAAASQRAFCFTPASTFPPFLLTFFVPAYLSLCHRPSSRHAWLSQDLEKEGVDRDCYWGRAIERKERVRVEVRIALVLYTVGKVHCIRRVVRG